jgi:Xaa-Pro aminopeptidase
MLLNRDRADAVMDNHGLAAIVASVPVDVFYLSGWSTDATWGFGDVALAVLPRDHALEPAVITVEVNTAQPQQRDGTWMKVIRPYRRKPGIGPAGRPVPIETAQDAAGIAADHAEAIAAYLEELGLKDCAIGFDERGLGFDVAAHMGNRIEVRDARDILRDIRMVKTPEELINIRAATRKTELGMMNAAEAIAAGVTCAEAERVFWSTVPLLGGRPVFLLITPFRPGYGRLPKAAPLVQGDTITFDATAEFDHYTSDIGRTGIIGEPSAQQLAAYNAIRTGWKNALCEFKAGLLSSEIEQKVVAHVCAAGNAEFTAASIHSVGLEHTDHPHPGNAIVPFRLVDGSVLSCDMPWSNPEIGRFHFEDLLYLNDNKVVTLNDTDSRIFACIDNRTVRVE